MILTKRKYFFNVGVYVITLPLLLMEAYDTILFSFDFILDMLDLQSVYGEALTSISYSQNLSLCTEFGLFPIAVFLLLLVHKQRNKPGKIVFWVMIAGSALRYVPFTFQFYNLLGISFGILSILIIIFIGFNTKNFVELTKQYRKNKEEQSQTNGAA